MTAGRNLAVATMIAVLLGAGIFVARSLPPRTLVMATGVEGGANHELGIRYRDVLAREGIKLVLQPTRGTLDNLHRCAIPGPGQVSVSSRAAPPLGKNRRNWSRLALCTMSRFGSFAAVESKDCKVSEFRSAPKEAAVERWRCEFVRDGPQPCCRRAVWIYARSCGREADCRRGRCRVHCDRLGVPSSPISAQGQGHRSW